MTTQTKVSICLPTCNRPDLIVECIESCLAQTHTNIEILIGDDSKDDRTQRMIATRYQHEPRIRYVRNTPSLGQARNVSSLFARAGGSKILLIHDDDYLAVDGVERLVSLWQRHPDLDVAFANQYEVDSAGRVDREASDRLNADFYRTKSAEGLQQQPGRTGLIQMFPNNGWMANADLVRRISYKERYGMCCDYVFGVELCLAAKQVYYLNEYVSFYRKTDLSISTTTKRSTSAASVSAYAFIEKLRLERQLEPARKLALRRIVPIVVSVYSRNHDPVKGLRIAAKNLFAYNYGFSMRLYYHLMMISRSMLTLKPR
ncbi:MAG: glycosyltransferase family 2 protein [Paraburkholderia sp.]|uniref:glycosyltransferase family 2 protein n=1 Tax=Paraburkholderia sp. TaxID=1926495 RepID=UPI0012272E0A|nr:glycosyltransferase family 2 protein [Paraburkholderia sp.]TAL92897.1 MAG: glycosyltransferase family 2 protein [Paraburkholderia sp.]